MGFVLRETRTQQNSFRRIYFDNKRLTVEKKESSRESSSSALSRVLVTRFLNIGFLSFFLREMLCFSSSE